MSTVNEAEVLSMSTIYHFTGAWDDKSLLGNKGANLVAMTKLRLPVPSGFVVSVDAFNEYKRTGKIPVEEINQALDTLEQRTGKKLGVDLAVSVRSSAAASMPGMMDTVLDVKNKTDVISAVKKVFDSWNNPRALDYL